MKKKKISLCILILSLYLLLTGYTFPQESPYVVVNCNFGQNYVITFPVDKAQYIVIEGLEIINTSSSTVYGYCANDERITFPTYDAAYQNISYQQTSTLHCTEIIENHLVDYSSRSLYTDSQPIITFAMLGGILLCGLLMVLKR